LIDPELGISNETGFRAGQLGRAARNTSELKFAAISKCKLSANKNWQQKYIPLVADELNVKQVEWVTDATELQDYQFKPQLRLLGPRFARIYRKLIKIGST